MNSRYGIVKESKLFSVDPRAVSRYLTQKRRSSFGFYALWLGIALSIAPFLGVFGLFVVLLPINDGRQVFENNLATTLTIVFSMTLLVLGAIWSSQYLLRIINMTMLSRIFPVVVVGLLGLGTVATYRFITFGVVTSYTFVLLQIALFALSAIFARSTKVVYAALIVFILSTAFMGLFHLVSWFVIPTYLLPVGAFLFLQQDLLRSHPRILNFVLFWGIVSALVVLLIQIISSLIFSPMLLAISDDSIFVLELTIGQYLAGAIGFNLIMIALLLLIGGQFPLLPLNVAWAIWRLQFFIGFLAFVFAWIFGVGVLFFFASFAVSASNNPVWMAIGLLAVVSIVVPLVIEIGYIRNFRRRN